MSTTTLAGALLDRTGIGALVRRLDSWPGILAFTYHRVGDATACPLHRDGFVSAVEFESHLRVLSAEADVVTVAEVADAARDDRSRRRGRRVLLTVDDGYRDAYDIAYPLLRAHGLTATFFLTTGFLDAPRAAWWDDIAWMVRGAAAGDDPLTTELAIRELVRRYQSLSGPQARALLDLIAARTGRGRCPPHVTADTWLTWDEVREMRDEGMTFGGHTVTHPVLARESRERQRAEIEACASALERELGEPMAWFSYPVGLRDCFDAGTQELVRSAGVRLAFSDYGGMSVFDDWDPHDVRRANPVASGDGRWMRMALTFPRLVARW